MIRQWIARPDQQELSLCNQRYVKSFNLEEPPRQASGTFVGSLTDRKEQTVSQYGRPVLFPVPMVTTPAVTTYNPTQANDDWRDTGDTIDAASLVESVGATGFHVRVSTAGAAAASWGIHWSADADL